MHSKSGPLNRCVIETQSFFHGIHRKFFGKFRLTTEDVKKTFYENPKQAEKTAPVNSSMRDCELVLKIRGPEIPDRTFASSMKSMLDRANGKLGLNLNPAQRPRSIDFPRTFFKFPIRSLSMDRLS